MKLSHFLNVEVVDPHADSNELKLEYGFELVEKPSGKYNAIIVAVNHHEYTLMNEEDFKSISVNNGLLVDIKGIYRNKIKELNYWTL
jgi:UDP-N-acetyl-D-galactosamine dehydrogenase